MLDIKKEKNGTELKVALAGRLDTTTATDLEKQLKEELDGVSQVILDLAELEYISSAGLRVLLAVHKNMQGVGTFKLVNATEAVKEIFDITGFSDILNVE
ncbi:MAG: STAS domain-containing protein [Lachnospiraceae bacterium]|nr:STAS domain-containing protein [Lachnospiraceae bacterium]